MPAQEEAQAADSVAVEKTSCSCPLFLVGFVGFLLGVVLTLAVLWVGVSYIPGVANYVAEVFDFGGAATEYVNPFSKEGAAPSEAEEYTNPFEGMEEEEYVNPFENL